MAEFQEIVREFHRLCETQRKMNKNTCDNCPIEVAAKKNILQCWRYVVEKPKEAEDIIMAWVAEHPKPIHPTWGEWLEKQGVIKKICLPGNEDDGTWCYEIMSKITELIPADIVEKLED